MNESFSVAQASGFDAPPHVTDPSGTIAVWWTDPPGIVLQLTRPARGTTAMAEWMVGPGVDLLVRRFPECFDMRIVLDLRQMTGRSATARSLLMQAAKALSERVAHVVVLPSPHMGPAYSKVIEGTAGLLRLLGMRVDIEHALDRVLERHGVRVVNSSGAARGAEPTPVSHSAIRDRSRAAQ